ncbi:PH domain-containing protein [Paenibacillus albidus]|uniref:PH domain-containing protein n=1 Tax=Paenibacillus albidus TaxID=2041023 RepID=UPI001BEB1D9F|nr:PH domain-containing protein [Paenibacillus albidus]MBT2289359.1 PH domain-containing protein [Paenibacillus albidus]
MRKSNEPLQKGVSRLHPVSIIYFLVKGTKGLLGYLPLIPVAVLAAPKLMGENVSRVGVTAVLVGCILIALILVGWARWRSFTYRIDGSAIYIEHGVWVKNKIWITKERIQSVDTKVSFYDRIFSLVRLQLETAANQKPEAVLSSITVEEAGRIRAVLGFAGASAVPVDNNDGEALASAASTQSQTPGEAVRKLSFRELLINSTSSDKFGIVLILSIGGIGKLWDNWLKDTNVWDFIRQLLGSGWIFWSVGLLVILSWILAVAVTFLTDYGFQIKLQDGKLIIEKGLLEKKQITLLPDRVQAVHLVNHALRRPFGLVSIHIIIAGSKENQEKSTVIFPLIRSEDVAGFLQQFIPAFSYEAKWIPLENTAWRSYTVIPALFGMLAAIPLMLWIPGYWAGLVLFLPLTAGILGQLSFNQVGWSFHDGQLALRYGVFSQHRVLIPKRRIQWYRMSQSTFQKNRKAATLKIALASGKEGKTFTLRHAPESQVSRVIHSISYSRQ